MHNQEYSCSRGDGRSERRHKGPGRPGGSRQAGHECRQVSGRNHPQRDTQRVGDGIHAAQELDAALDGAAHPVQPVGQSLGDPCGRIEPGNHTVDGVPHPLSGLTHCSAHAFRLSAEPGADLPHAGQHNLCGQLALLGHFLQRPDRALRPEDRPRQLAHQHASTLVHRVQFIAAEGSGPQCLAELAHHTGGRARIRPTGLQAGVECVQDLRDL